MENIPQTKKLSSLQNLRTTAAREFALLLDDTHISYQRFVARHETTLNELMLQHEVTDSHLSEIECNYRGWKSVFGGGSYRIEWFKQEKLMRRSRRESEYVLLLACLFRELRKLVFFRSSPLKYRVARDEMRRAWWYAVVVPELARDAKTSLYSTIGRSQRNRGKDRPAGSIVDPSARREFFLRLLKHHPRAQATKILADKCGVRKRQARRLAAVFAGAGEPGRPETTG